jgi:spermidine synthase
MFLSGASSLIVETILFRLLSYTFGNTAYAASTVLAVFMGGLAGGSAVFGKLCASRHRSLKLYGLLELLVAAYSVALPLIVSSATQLYIVVCHALDLHPGHLLPLQIAVAAVVAGIPAFFMGGTLPAVAHFLSSDEAQFENTIDRVYAANTFGAAAGTLLAAYVLVPPVGIRGALLIAAAIGICIFVTALTFRDAPLTSIPRSVMVDTQEAAVPGKLAIYLPFAFLSGAITLGFEVVWNHALGFLIGNTVYCFALMLFSILIGLACGARLVARKLGDPQRWWPGLVAAQALAGLVVLGSLPAWQYLPSLFARPGLVGIIDGGVVTIVGLGRLLWIAIERTGSQKHAGWFRRNEAVLLGVATAATVIGLAEASRSDKTAFLLGDVLRFICAFGVLIVPSILLGVTFPLLLNLCSQGRQKSSQIGIVYSVNTCGTVLGSLVAGFVLLPRMGSFGTIRVLALLSIATSIAAIFVLTKKPKRQLAGAAIVFAAAIILCVVVPRWDSGRINGGGYAYFSTNPWQGGNIRYMQEDVQSGLTTVIESKGKRFLLSNAKYQGDNADGIDDQIRFGLIPMLFTRRTDRALVIGLGTGNTLRTVTHFPFRKIDVVEIAPGVVTAARSWFREVNDGVLDSDPRVHLTLADARNFLLLSQDKYDLITIEITSLWISGQGDLYNKEFYELVSRHLTPTGVLQQWVAIHHLRQKELFLILNTAGETFPHASLFLGSTHALLIAGTQPLTCDSGQIATFSRAPGVQRDLTALRLTNMQGLLPEMRLNEASMREAISTLAAENGFSPQLVSTDLFPRLEYGAPKGLLSGKGNFSANVAFFDRFRGAMPGILAARTASPPVHASAAVR